MEIKRTKTGLPENEFKDLPPLYSCVGDYLITLGGKRWQNPGKSRIYFNDEQITAILGSKHRLHGCVYYDEVNQGYVNQGYYRDPNDAETKVIKILIEAVAKCHELQANIDFD